MISVRVQLFLAAIIFLCVGQMHGAEPGSETATEIFSPRFKTLKVSVEGDFMSPPVIDINSDRRILISFDEIADDMQYLRYRLLHCNADWSSVSRLLESEYIDGFNLADVKDYGFSTNTFIHYVNYHICIPNEDMRPLRSGNYLLQVFREDFPDEVILQARFAVSENIVPIQASVSTVTDWGVNDTYQQLSIVIDATDINITDPFNDIIMEISQNADPYSRRYLTRPLRMHGRKLIYEHIPDLIFPAGNEYRRFETVQVPGAGMHIDSTRYHEPMYHAWLTPDHVRACSQYSYDRTQGGRYMVREYNASDSDLGADYVMTHFLLDMPQQPEADVYVQGEFSGYALQPMYQMQYAPELCAYTLAMPLKQGSYNYRYTIKPRVAGSHSTPSPIEGDLYETRNEYYINVYYRQPGARADRLIGSSIVVVE